jgi:carboxypeptidase Q
VSAPTTVRISPLPEVTDVHPMLRRSAAIAALVLIALAPRARAADPEPTAELRSAAEVLLQAGLASSDSYDGLRELCDRVGNRLSGSASLDSAIAWAAARMRAEGLSNVHTERVMVPVWVRGEESARMTAPHAKPLRMLGLGMSVGTPPEGVEAEVVTVNNFRELDSLGAAGVRGRIVLYDVPFTGYGQTVRYRGAGASRAAAYGAVAALVRSITPVSLATPHTGALNYVDSLPKIPSAALSIEDATLLHRLCDAGLHPRVRLRMQAHRMPDAVSANVIGEVTGRENPEEIVAIGGHIDSWDVGQGAQDDGTGMLVSMEAAHLMQKLGLHPRRTVRVVLWVNEENGLRGGRAYREAHAAEVSRHVAAIESDSGNGPAAGFTLDFRNLPAPGDTAARDTTRTIETLTAMEFALAQMRGMSALLGPTGATRMAPGGGGADISPLAQAGVPALGMNHDEGHYFDIHHTDADTFDKVDPASLARNTASMAVMAFALAEWPQPLRPRPSGH